jgi:hypothetical protein
VFRSDGEQADVIEAWALFDARVEKLVHRTVDQRDQMPVVLLAVVELVHRPARADLALLEQPGLLELRQHAVDGGKPQVKGARQLPLSMGESSGSGSPDLIEATAVAHLRPLRNQCGSLLSCSLFGFHGGWRVGRAGKGFHGAGRQIVGHVRSMVR